MISVSQLGYIGINSTDVEAWRRFVSEPLGMAISDKDDQGTLYVRMDDRHHRFLIHPSDNNDVAYIGWQVPNEEALDAIAAQIEEAGTPVTPGTPEEIGARGVLGLIKFQDPGGLPSEIFFGAEMARNFFHPSRAITGFKTGNLGLGHVVVWHPDHLQGMRFYRDVLGFRISDYSERMAFLHCNPRHHSLALFKAPPNLRQRMNHFMVQYNSIDDVGSAYDICEGRGDRFATTLGRHPNDQSVSFYVNNPSGWHTECAWGSREVDDATWQTEFYSSQGGSYWGHRRHAELEMNLGSAPGRPS